MNRRIFIGRAAASAVATATVLTANEASRAAASDPVWGALDIHLAKAQQAWATAAARHTEAQQRFRAMAPSMPIELIVSPWERCAGMSGEQFRDQDGELVWSPNGYPEVVVTTNYLNFWARESCHFWKFEKTLAMKRPIAEKYEQDCLDAEARSGRRAAQAEVYESVSALENVVARIMETPVLTLPGLLLKAQALTAYARCGSDQAENAGRRWGVRLAEDAQKISAQENYH